MDHDQCLHVLNKIGSFERRAKYEFALQNTEHRLEERGIFTCNNLIIIHTYANEQIKEKHVAQKPFIYQSNFETIYMYIWFYYVCARSLLTFTLCSTFAVDWSRLEHKSVHVKLMSVYVARARQVMARISNGFDSSCEFYTLYILEQLSKTC